LAAIICLGRMQMFSMHHAFVAISLNVLMALVVAACGAPASPTTAATKPAASTVAPAAVTTQAASTVASKVPSVPPAAPIATAKPAASPIPAAKIKRGGILQVAKSTEWGPNLDPPQVTSPYMGLEMIIETLVRGKLDQQTNAWSMEPWLVEGWDIQSPKTIVFKLRKGIVFHDGSVLDAKVIKWNMDRARTHPKSAAKVDFDAIESVDVVDDYTFRLNLKRPPAGLWGRLSNIDAVRGGFISQVSAEKQGDDFVARTPVGTGPMVFQEWKTGDRMTMKKWDKYWQKGEDGQPLPYLDGVVYRWINDATPRMLELRTGAVQFAEEIGAKDFTAIRAEPNLELVEFIWTSNVRYVFFNMQKPPFGGNTKLRQAALYAIDRDNVAKAVGLGAGYPSTHYWIKGVLGYNEKAAYDYQPEKAKQLLREAGYPNGIDITNTYTVVQDTPRTAEVVKQMWDAVNLRTKLDGLERTAGIAKWQAFEYEVGTSSRSNAPLDPDDDRYRLATGGSFNFPGWSDPEMDKCMEEGATEIDAAKRDQIYQRCNMIIHENAPYGQIWTRMYNVALDKRLVKGWEPARIGGWMLRAWLDK
jgi:peptide/nickel transport system substrate-binding protein